MNRYPVDVEERMLALYRSLSEKDRRRYAAVEAIKVGHGGVAYVAKLFGCDPDTVRHGEADIAQLPEDEAADRVEKRADESQLARLSRGWSRPGRSRGRAARPARRSIPKSAGPAARRVRSPRNWPSRVTRPAPTRYGGS
jgi:hypothetical protein